MYCTIQMTSNINNRHHNIISYAGLIIFIITAIFSSGYNHFDEHFQILEFCNYKLGKVGTSSLPWEFHEKLRPGIQPFIAYLFAKALFAFNLYNPFKLALLLRLFMALLSWIAVRKTILVFQPDFNNSKIKSLYILAAYLLWFVPYIAVRFSAENFSCILLFLAISAIYPYIKAENTMPISKLLICGFLLGFAFFSRIQIIFALAGMVFWLLFQDRLLRDWVLIALSFIIAILVNVYIDYWLYNQWTFTPYNYFNANILQQKASSFGTSPWYQYILFFIETAVPPLSIVLLVYFIIGLRQKAGHLFGIICISFLIGHFMIGHKELRFLFPILPAFIFITTYGLRKTIANYANNKTYKYLAVLLVTTNILVLLYKMHSPATSEIPYYKAVYNSVENKKTILFVIGNSPYHKVDLELNFYKPERLQIAQIRTPYLIPLLLSSTHYEKILLLDDGDQIPETIGKFSVKRIYNSLPDWLLKTYKNSWPQHYKIRSLYEVSIK